MKVKRFVILILALVFALGGLVQAQQTQQQTSTPAASEPSSLDTQGIKLYLLGPGDVLDIRVFGQPDLSGNVEVDSDGNLSSLPFIETAISVKCRTDKDVQKEIANAYTKFIKNPQVSVRVVERNSRKPATIFGAVHTPTRVEMKRVVRLNELVAVAAGFTERAAGTIQILHTEPLMCPGPGEEEEAKPIDGTRIPLKVIKISELRIGKPEANPIIRPGDYVLVTEAEPVYITGAVMSPGGVYLREQLTLSRALAMVGGAKKEAKLSEVRVYRQVPGSTTQEVIPVNLTAIKKNQEPDFLLHPYDVIEISESGLFSASRWSTTLLSALTGGIGNAAASTGTFLPTRILY